MRHINLSDVNKQVQVKEGKLFFDNREVLYCNFIKADTVAALYVIRVRTGTGDLRFVTGLDLVGDKFWLGGVRIKLWVDQNQEGIPSAYYDEWEYVEHVLNNLCDDTAGKEWIVCEEADFDVY